MQVLRDAFGPEDQELVHRFYTHWFAIDTSVRDLFPPEMHSQRAAFAHAMHWLYGELVDQRAEQPVAFLAQLGRDHRKYGVRPAHYQTLRRALYATLRAHLAGAWTDAVAAAAEQSLNLFVGVMSGAADSDDSPAWWDGTVVEHTRVSRDLAVVRLRLDRPWTITPGSTSTCMSRSAPAAGATCPPQSPPTRAASSSTCGWCRADWSATPSSPKRGPATGGGCRVHTAASTSTATATTC